MILVEFIRYYGDGALEQQLKVTHEHRVARGWPNQPRFSAFVLPLPDPPFRPSRAP